MKMILSVFISFTALIILLTACPSVNAADTLFLSMKTDKEVRSDRNFSLYISCRCSDGIGALRAKLRYDKELLVLKSARLENKTSSDIFMYEDKLEYLHLCFTNAPERPEYRLIKLTFAPIKKQDDLSYDFDLFFCEACKNSDEYIYADELPFLTVDVVSPDNSKAKSSDTSHSNRSESSHKAVSKAESSNESRNTVSKSSAGADRSRTSRAYSKSSKASETVLEKTSGVNEETVEDEPNENNDVYYINTKTKGSSDDKHMLMYPILGVAIVFVAAIIFAFSEGKKRGRKNDDK